RNRCRERGAPAIAIPRLGRFAWPYAPDRDERCLAPGIHACGCQQDVALCEIERPHTPHCHVVCRPRPALRGRTGRGERLQRSAAKAACLLSSLQEVLTRCFLNIGSKQHNYGLRTVPVVLTPPPGRTAPCCGI